MSPEVTLGFFFAFTLSAFVCVAYINRMLITAMRNEAEAYRQQVSTIFNKSIIYDAADTVGEAVEAEGAQSAQDISLEALKDAHALAAKKEKELEESLQPDWAMTEDGRRIDMNRFEVM
jgi:lipid II:glycine glycyltransferase (peptidoglycan interpeptide bridge formation enzyme)